MRGAGGWGHREPSCKTLCSCSFWCAVLPLPLFWLGHERWRPRPRFCWPQAGFKVWQEDQNVFGCWDSMWDVIWHGELGSSLSILNAGMCACVGVDMRQGLRGGVGLGRAHAQQVLAPFVVVKRGWGGSRAHYGAQCRAEQLASMLGAHS